MSRGGERYQRLLRVDDVCCMVVDWGLGGGEGCRALDARCCGWQGTLSQPLLPPSPLRTL